MPPHHLLTHLAHPHSKAHLNNPIRYVQALASTDWLTAAASAASGQWALARQAAARAAHTCPWDATWRVRLGTVSAAASAVYLGAAGRAAPSIATPAPNTTRVGAAALRKAHIPLSQQLRAAAQGTAPVHAHVPSAANGAAAAATTAVQLLVSDPASSAAAVRTAGLISAAPGPEQMAGLRSEIAKLTSRVHADPGNTHGWYLVALLSVQLMTACGNRSAEARQALVR